GAYESVLKIDVPVTGFDTSKVEKKINTEEGYDMVIQAEYNGEIKETTVKVFIEDDDERELIIDPDPKKDEDSDIANTPTVVSTSPAVVDDSDPDNIVVKQTITVSYGTTTLQLNPEDIKGTLVASGTAITGPGSFEEGTDNTTGVVTGLQVNDGDDSNDTVVTYVVEAYNGEKTTYIYTIKREGPDDIIYSDDPTDPENPDADIKEEEETDDSNPSNIVKNVTITVPNGTTEVILNPDVKNGTIESAEVTEGKGTLTDLDTGKVTGLEVTPDDTKVTYVIKGDNGDTLTVVYTIVREDESATASPEATDDAEASATPDADKTAEPATTPEADNTATPDTDASATPDADKTAEPDKTEAPDDVTASPKADETTAPQASATAPANASTAKPASSSAVATKSSVTPQDKIFDKSNQSDITEIIDGNKTVSKITINGTEVPNNMYTVQNGTLTISKDYLKNLEVGDYPVTITYTDGTTMTFNLKVVAYDESTVVKYVPIFKMKKNVVKGSKFKINLRGISSTAVLKYRSTNKKVASINKKGVIKGKNYGRTKIKAFVIQNGSYYKVLVNVKVIKKTAKTSRNFNLTKKALTKVSGELPEFNVYRRIASGKSTKLVFTNVAEDATYDFYIPKKYKKEGKNLKIIKSKMQGHKVICWVKGIGGGFVHLTAEINQNGHTYMTRIFCRVDNGNIPRKIKRQYLK
ncbi:MAG: hypothetical protein K6G11_01565, partial [Lachnospiraceae bacterium]|nr:hypothetical protein [Lachnospiraceae bacterium]